MIKEFFKRNLVISLFGIASVFIAVIYAATYMMPDYLEIEGWFSLLTNIAVSYIAALVFYILQVYKPECEGRKRAKESLTPLFEKLIELIELTILCCRKYVSISADEKVTIQWVDPKEKSLCFNFVQNGSSVKNGRRGVIKTECEIQNLGTVYKSQFDEIKNRIDFRDCDPEIVHALSKLESSHFFSHTLPSLLMVADTIVSYPGFKLSVDQLEKDVIDFKKCCGIATTYEIKDAEPMDIAMYKVARSRKMLQAASIRELNAVVMRQYIEDQLKAQNIENVESDSINQIIESILAEMDRKEQQT